MTPTLRKRHRQIWTVLTLLLPIGFLAAWMSFPIPPPNEELRRIVSDRLEGAKLLAEVSSYDLEVQWLENQAGDTQLEVHVKHPLRAPSAWIYAIGNELPARDREQQLFLLGELAGMGIFRFEVDSIQVIDGIVIHDHIKQERLTQLYFKP